MVFACPHAPAGFLGSLLLPIKHFCGWKGSLICVRRVGDTETQTSSIDFSLQMIDSLHCNLRNNKEQVDCIMHYGHSQEERRVKRTKANVVICSVQSLQLGVFIWCSWRERLLRKLRECRWISVWGNKEKKLFKCFWLLIGHSEENVFHIETALNTLT